MAVSASGGKWWKIGLKWRGCPKRSPCWCTSHPRPHRLPWSDQIVCHKGRHCQTHHHPLPKWCYLYTSTQGFPSLRAYFLTFFKECFCDTTTLQNDPQMRCSFVWICTTRCIIVEKRHLHCFPPPLSASNLWTRVEPLWDWYCGLRPTLEHWYFAQLISQPWQAQKQLNIWTLQNG